MADLFDQPDQSHAAKTDVIATDKCYPRPPFFHATTHQLITSDDVFDPKSEMPDNTGDTIGQGPHPGYGPAFTPLKTPCHIWQRSFDDDGYGYFRHKGKVIRAHVHYYVGKFGPVPNGLELDHTCRNRACVNPDHLEAVTHLENCRRGRLVKTGMTIEKARTAREMKAAGKTQREIGEHLGIGVSLVAQIVGNRCWKESPPAPSLAASIPTQEAQ